MKLSNDLSFNIPAFVEVGSGMLYKLSINIKRERGKITVNGRKVSMDLEKVQRDELQLVFSSGIVRYRIFNFFALNPKDTVEVEKIHNQLSHDY